MSKKQLKKLQQQLITASDAELPATTIRLADEYLVLSPSSVKALIDKAHALAKLNRYDESLAIYQLAIDALSDEDSPDVIYGEIGNLYRGRGDFALAEQYYRKQIAADADDATGFIFLGTLQLQQGDPAAAEETIRQGLNCAHGCLDELNYALGCVLRAAGDYLAASACFAEVLRLSPDDKLAKTALKDVRQALAPQ